MNRCLVLAALGLSAACSPPSTVDSCILVVVDTLRADHLGIYGYPRGTSPELDHWARRGVVFERAISTSPWTLPAFGTLFTGQLPSTHRAGIRVAKWRRARLDASLPTLAELASNAGLATAAFVSNPHLDSRIGGVDRGFDLWDNSIDGTEFRRGQPMSDFRSADRTVEHALEWIDERGGDRFLLVVHFLEPHWPQAPRDEDLERFAGEEARELLAYTNAEFEEVMLQRSNHPDPAVREGFRRGITDLYDAEVLSVDRATGRLLQSLDESGHLDRSLVLFTADHGEELLDHGAYDHGHSFHSELLNVPLVAWAPGAAPGARSTPVSLLDVMPTALAALGLAPPSNLPGVSLWPALRGGNGPTRPLIADGTSDDPWAFAVVSSGLKLVAHATASDLRLYDWKNDPEELTNLAADRPEAVRSLLRIAKGALAADRAGAGEEFPPELREKLRSLGYLD